MFEHFGQRLKRDLKQLVDRRISASETASGSLQRVRIWYSTKPKRLKLTPLQSSGVEVNVISHKKQRSALHLSYIFLALTLALSNSFAVWYGGSLLASLVSKTPPFMFSS